MWLERKTEMEKKVQTSDSLTMALILAFAGGFFDIYTYMTRGKVFANAQTGNMVLLGLKISEGDITGIVYYLVPLLACVSGIILAYYIKRRFKDSETVHWRQIILFVEVLFIIAVSFVPRGQLDALVNAVISFVCSVQMQSFRKLKGGPVATNMCTGNLRSAVEFCLDFFETGNEKSKNKCKDYFIVVSVFILGAIVGGALIKIFDYKAVIFTAIPLLTGVFIMKEKESE